MPRSESAAVRMGCNPLFLMDADEMLALDDERSEFDDSQEHFYSPCQDQNTLIKDSATVSLAKQPFRPSYIELEYPQSWDELRLLFVPRQNGKRRHRKKSERPPRPLNAFMLYRQVLSEALLKHKINLRDEIRRSGCRHPFKEMSHLVGLWWQSESNETKKAFKRLSALAEEEHVRVYGNNARVNTQKYLRTALTGPQLPDLSLSLLSGDTLPPTPDPHPSADFTAMTTGPVDPDYSSLPPLPWYPLAPPSFIPLPGVFYVLPEMHTALDGHGHGHDEPGVDATLNAQDRDPLPPTQQMAAEGSPMDEFTVALPWPNA
ncbi:hypothetical protein M427DRAFT_66747 [Gonapodya prolifera JEL478]|uniref:HMG box domain-containing protein n=1 Tax=Gonapodya prolifera (strain JEL478) TaxID=1344416 RepID=A0A139AUG3_GONPJ|nr:hypothetical protein M427DRAFT_66747 [Gonapodya prolifera JEL478]|eukprot:KXS20213.1 hypothetical protein M427DRAFT_66747 [Gonapodya prolifera JEL478]